MDLEVARNNGSKADHHLTWKNAHIQHLIPKYLTPVELQYFLLRGGYLAG